MNKDTLTNAMEFATNPSDWKPEQVDTNTLVLEVKSLDQHISALRQYRLALAEELVRRFKDMSVMLEGMGVLSRLPTPAFVNPDTTVHQSVPAAPTKPAVVPKPVKSTEASDKSLYMQAYDWMPDTFKAEDLQNKLSEHGHSKTRAYNLLTWWKSKDMVAKAPGLFWRKL